MMIVKTIYWLSAMSQALHTHGSSSHNNPVQMFFFKQIRKLAREQISQVHMAGKEVELRFTNCTDSKTSTFFTPWPYCEHPRLHDCPSGHGLGFQLKHRDPEPLRTIGTSCLHLFYLKNLAQVAFKGQRKGECFPGQWYQLVPKVLRPWVSFALGVLTAVSQSQLTVCQLVFWTVLNFSHSQTHRFVVSRIMSTDGGQEGVVCTLSSHLLNGAHPGPLHLPVRVKGPVMASGQKSK